MCFVISSKGEAKIKVKSKLGCALTTVSVLCLNMLLYYCAMLKIMLPYFTIAYSGRS